MAKRIVLGEDSRLSILRGVNALADVSSELFGRLWRDEKQSAWTGLTKILVIR